MSSYNVIGINLHSLKQPPVQVIFFYTLCLGYWIMGLIVTLQALFEAANEIYTLYLVLVIHASVSEIFQNMPQANNCYQFFVIFYVN